MHYWPSIGWDDALWELSWVNINMLMATIPQYKPAPKPDEPQEEDGEIDAGMAEDLKNFLKM